MFKYALILAFVSLGILTGCSTNAPTPEPVKATPEPAKVQITEDDPRWDCHTMGNKKCGTPPLPDAVKAEQAADQAQKDDDKRQAKRERKHVRIIQQLIRAQSKVVINRDCNSAKNLERMVANAEHIGGWTMEQEGALAQIDSASYNMQQIAC